MYCNKCGAKIPKGNSFCSNCGSKVSIINDNKDLDSEEISSNNETFEDNSVSFEEFNNSYTDDTQDFSEYEDADYYNDIYEDLSEEQNFNEQTSVSNNTLNKKRKNKSKILLIIGIVVLIAIISVGVIFRNNIKYFYYLMKYNKATELSTKEEYAEKAFSNVKKSSTKKMLKDSLLALGEKDIEYAEKRLNEIKEKITMNDYKELACTIKSSKINKLCQESRYDDALLEFEEMANLGEDIRKDKNYDKIMLNICAELTGNSVRGSKNLLMEEDNIYYYSFNSNSNFDDIVEVKTNDSTVKINLYTYSDGKYSHVDTKSFNKSYHGKMKGVYTCDKVNNNEKKAVYVYYEGNKSSLDNSIGGYGVTSNNMYYKTISVIGVSDNKLSIIASVIGNKEVNCDDFNNDGIYEIYSKSTNDGGWFKVFWDGTVPQKIANENGGEVTTPSGVHQSSQTINLKTSDYIFSYSNTSYLSDYDLKDLDKNTLALARNEIFARHGYQFKEEPFVTYFNNKTWYTPNPNFKGDDSELNKYEIANYKKILEWEDK